MAINQLTLDQKKELLAQKEGYAIAQAKGDKAGMASYNQKANELRATTGMEASKTGVLTADQLKEMIAIESNAQKIKDDATNSTKATQDAINTYMTQQKAAGDAAYTGAVAGIDAAEGSAIAEQQAGVPQAEKDYTSQVEAINRQQYADLERSKVMAEQRGIQSSQQQQGIESGIAQNTNTNIAGAGADRVTRIQTITDRIKTIKEQANAQRTQAGAARDAGIAQAGGAIALQSIQRQWQVEDRNKAESFAVDQKLKEQQHDVQMANLSSDLQIKVKTLENTFAKELQGIDFENRVKLADFDQDFQREILASEQGFKEKIFKLESADRKAIASMEISARKALFNAETARQEKFFKLDQTAKYAFAQFDTDEQIRFMTAKDALEKGQTEDPNSLAKEIWLKGMSDSGALGSMLSNQQKADASWKDYGKLFNDGFWTKGIIRDPGFLKLFPSFNKWAKSTKEEVAAKATQAEKQAMVDSYNNIIKTMEIMGDNGLIPKTSEKKQ